MGLGADDAAHRHPEIFPLNLPCFHPIQQHPPRMTFGFLHDLRPLLSHEESIRHYIHFTGAERLTKGLGPAVSRPRC